MRLPLNNEDHRIYDEDGDSIAVVFDEANAAFIVKAVNNHYQLLDVLKDLVYATNNPHSTWETVRGEVKKAIDAIKQAEDE